jgi:predicted ester cyclase
MFFAAFPDLHWTIEEDAAEGDKAWARFTWRGTHRGDFLGIPAIGNQLEVNGVVINRIVEGKIVDSRILMNELSLMQQLVVRPPPE